MGLLDSISRLSLSTDDIYTAANRTIADVGPFTDAVLGKHPITDIIRDAEEGEHTLFTHRTIEASGIRRGVDVRPVPAIGGLKSIAAIPGVPIGVMEKEADVDLLLAAALRLVETYGPMPRAQGQVEQLQDRAVEVRSRISILEEELEELKASGSAPPVEPEAPSLKDEEKAIVNMEAKLAAARRKRDSLRDQLKSKQRARSAHGTGHLISTPTAAARTRTRPGGASKIANPFLSHRPTNLDPDATTNIAEHLPPMSESLVDERPPTWADDSILSTANENEQSAEEEEEEAEGVVPGVGADSLWEGEGVEDEIGEEATVVLAIPPAVEYSPPPSPVRETVAPPLRASSRPSLIAERTPASIPAPVPAPVVAQSAAPVKPTVEVKPKPAMQEKKVDLKITPEMETNAALIWSTVGKVIAPSSNYGSDTPTPGAAETISILQSLSSQSFSNTPSSPSSASTLQPLADPAPAQTILTAILLLYLLREGPSPLPAVRSALAEKEGDGTAGLGVKALYACVAKKLLKIDRKGREATVRFE